MIFKTGQACPICNAEIWVYPCSTKMSKVNARSLPGWTRCECTPRFNELCSAEFDELVPGWRDRLAPDEGDGEELPEISFDEALEDVKNLINELNIT